MKNCILYCATVLLLFTSCKKGFDALVEKVPSASGASPAITASGFTIYTLKRGQHFANFNSYIATDVTEMKFIVKFDSSAIYQSVDPVNQYDINKLYGFADNNATHQKYSARFGWRWSDNALRLFAYVYNNGAVISKELTTIAIGAETFCSIKITAEGYLFTVNDGTELLPRKSTTSTAKGYQLYPYFGGDETAPHDITIYLKNL